MPAKKKPSPPPGSRKPLKKGRREVSKKITNETEGSLEMKPERADGFSVVGVGASAGGIRALEGMLAGMPKDIAFALVVIQHLDPKRGSMMPKILSRATEIPVREAQDGEKIEPGLIYVKPPDKDLTIAGRRFKLKKFEQTGVVRLPIDLFFRSLAEDIGDKAIGIILSGTGTDGSHGAKEIQGAGGLVLAQDEKQAEHSGMPRSAIESGAVDMMLPVEKMGEQLVRFVDHPLLARDDMEEDRAESLQQDHIRKILHTVRIKTGHDFSDYKPSTVRRRIARRMAVNRTESIPEYASYIRENPDEAEELFKDLVVNVTSFFRDAQVFAHLEKEVIPGLLAAKKQESEIRIWVPGCATGEEAYSLAMLFQEALQRTHAFLKLKIFATDINPDTILKAREGIFRDNIAADVSQERLKNFFETKGQDVYKIQGRVRESIVFAAHDITRDAPLVRMDLVSCRNLLIYMNSELQKRVIPILHYSLNAGGILVLGTSEGVGGYQDLFEAMDKRNKIFRKTGDGFKYWGHIASLPAENRAAGKESERIRGDRGERMEENDSLTSELLEEALSDLEQSGAIVDEWNKVIYFMGNTKPFLYQPSGKPTLEVIHMAEEGIRHRLQIGLGEARKTRAPVHIEGLHLLRDDPFQQVDIKVTPLRRAKGCVLVTFEPKQVEESRGPEEQNPSNQEGLTREEILEQKLRAVRQQLQTTIEEFETTNEELKSANEELQANNEELQSTNEELESSREELQSTNEELETANLELQRRNEESTLAEDDARNLFAATEVGTLFLDRNLMVKRFTPPVTRLFNLMERDIGRSLADITTNFSYDKFNEDVRDVIDNLNKKEAEVKNRDGRWLNVRMLPYRSSKNVIEGVVITFNDVTQLKEMELHAQEARITAESIMGTIRQPFLVLDDQLRVRSANEGFYEGFHITQKEAVGSPLFELQGGRWEFARLREDLEELLAEKDSGKKQYEYPDPDGGEDRIRMIARRVDVQDGRPVLVLLTFEKKSEKF